MLAPQPRPLLTNVSTPVGRDALMRSKIVAVAVLRRLFSCSQNERERPVDSRNVPQPVRPERTGPAGAIDRGSQVVGEASTAGAGDRQVTRPPATHGEDQCAAS